MATEVEQRSTNSGHGVGHEMDMDKDTLLSRAERRPLTLSRRRILYQAPEFIQRLSGEDTVVEGSTVQFECSFKGFPKPTVTWFKDDVSLEFTNRISLESFEEGSFALVIKDAVRSDEATYQCRIENSEGSCSSTIYLSVKGSSRSPKRKKSLSPNRRMVSYPSFFPTIEEKIVEEEKEEEEVSRQEPSPLTQLYDDNKLRSRHTWPKFVGDWAFADDDDGGPCPRDDDDIGGPFYACGSNDDDDVFTENIPSETLTHPVVHTTASSSACQQNSPVSHTNSQTQRDANNPSHSTFSRTVPQAGESLSSCTDTTCSSGHYTTSSYNQSAVAMTSLPTESSDRSQSDHYQPMTANRRRRHCSVDDTDEEDLSTIGAYQSDNNTRARDPVSAVSSGDGQPAVVKKKSPPPKGQRKRPPRKTVNHIGGVLATSFLLSSFTFCALCIDTSPEIFVIVIFVAAFMFQVIQQLNAM